MNLVIGSVSGAGKTTIGKLLSEALDLPSHDADDFHPPANIEKMVCISARAIDATVRYPSPTDNENPDTP